MEMVYTMADLFLLWKIDKFILVMDSIIDTLFVNLRKRARVHVIPVIWPLRGDREHQITVETKPMIK